MASYPPGQCCAATGFKHEGTPTGEDIKINAGKIAAYVAKPAADKNNAGAGIILIPDIFAISNNSKLLADQFAGAGYTTLIPDIFNGDEVFEWGKYDIMKYITEGADATTPIRPSILAAWDTASAASGINVGYTAHPSFIEEKELAAITGPLAISAAETDAIFPAEKRHQSEVILKETGQPYQINLFSGVEHGFATRGDMSIKHLRFAKEQAFQQAAAWFDYFLL
ncbi:dienelactone hydrolase [Verticillium alfalfae VaMs.102]|uniref:Dienelactone hydrolase n=1 Tax=Verticillium alfalfae (strain VaMs.102 / ATCC MYA-4576 / FGSC 10136) TaxID=526221 RepID=C9SYQ2_VERA1|nr:dienelactone hydrolase [Verticillium alfalfae VaMs.102]EEY23917.1 dienelactone hydrolase [Verticillium alfalfae VaMs.102]